MEESSWLNGNRIIRNKEGQHVYTDGEPASKDGKLEYHSCPRCGELPTKKGHDACLGKLPGVKFACCGHGIKPGYIAFENGVRVTLGKYSTMVEKG